MHRDADDAAIHSDAYIDALLSAHARLPVRLPGAGFAPTRSLRHAIRLLERGLPRFHPSFLFEERLAQQLREAHADPAAMSVMFDRRLLMGGAIASGFSIAGAAMFAWRRRRD